MCTPPHILGMRVLNQLICCGSPTFGIAAPTSECHAQPTLMTSMDVDPAPSVRLTLTPDTHGGVCVALKVSDVSAPPTPASKAVILAGETLMVRWFCFFLAAWSAMYLMHQAFLVSGSAFSRMVLSSVVLA